jgi:hypothetical protein
MGKLSVITADSRWSVGCDALAVVGDRTGEVRVGLLSAAGPETAIKAVHACLVSNVKARFEFDESLTVRKGKETWTRYCPTMERDKDGYDTHKVRLGFNTWHLLAVSKLPGFMPVMSETALNRELRSPLFTTPYLREWVPYIAERLTEAEMLRILPGFNTTCAFLKAGSPELDEVVSVGVQEGHLTIGRVA